MHSLKNRIQFQTTHTYVTIKSLTKKISQKHPFDSKLQAK